MNTYFKKRYTRNHIKNQHWLNFACALLLFFPVFLSAAESAIEFDLEIIELKHRSIEDVIPVIKPLLNKNERVSGTANQLIVKASAETIALVKKILKKIDTPVKQFIVTVKYARESQQDQRSVNLSTNISPSHSNTEIRVISTHDDENSFRSQQLQVTEGHWANFNIIQLIPINEFKLFVSSFNSSVNSNINSGYSSGYDSAFQSSTEYKKTGAALRVLATMRNKAVHLKIATHYSKQNTYDNRKIDSISAMTEISGPFGKWIDIGGTASSMNNHNPREKVYTTNQPFIDNRRIWIKVDSLDNK